MIIEQAGRKLLQIEDRETWDKLPKNVRALPVYYFRTETGIELWPMWNDYLVNPTIRVEP